MFVGASSTSNVANIFVDDFVVYNAVPANIGASVPAAPTIGTITPSNGQLSVAFTAGADGGSAITNYKYSSNGGSTFTAVSPAATTSPITITGLSNGTPYNVQIRAVNAIGDGTATASTAATPRTTPSAPAITGITAGNSQLSVAFTAGADGGSAITNYKYSIDGGTLVSVGSTSSPFIITGLTNNQSYAVRLYAVNTAGDSVASLAANGTPLAPSSPTITVAPATFGTAFSTTYGTASSTQTFAVSGSTLGGDVTVTAPAGLEISLSSGSGYAESLTLSQISGAVSSTTIYARLKATAAAGSYNSASIGVSGGGATAQSVATSGSGNTVAPKAVTITGLSATGKVYDGTTSVTITGTATYGGLANGESHSVTDSVTWAFSDKNVGTGKVLSRSASYTAPNANYSLPTQPSLSADITPKELTGSFTANNKTFDNSTVATLATRAVSGAIEGDTVNHTGGTATFGDVNVGDGKTVTLASATLTGADAGNYTLTSVSTTTANITQGAAVITFAALPAGKKVGDAAFPAGATATLGATISYSSSNTAVATVNASTGSISLVAPGVTTITATVVGTANFTGDTESQTLNVGGAGGPLNLASDLIITGIIDGPRTGGIPKAIEIYVAKDVADLSIYKVQNYGNGAITAGTPLVLSGAATAGDYLYVASETTQFTAYFGFAPDFASSALNVNGNDVVALTKNDTLVDVFGTIGVDPAVDTTFNYLDTWFYRKSNTEPSSTFTLADWTFPEGQSDALDSLGTSGVNPSVGDPLRMPIGTYTISTPGTPGITPSGSFAAVTTTYGTASDASATTATVTGGSLTANITATAPAGFQVSSDGTTYGGTATFTQSSGFASGTLYLRLAASAAVGAYNSQVVTLSSAGASNQTVAIASSTVSAGSLAGGDIVLTPVGDGSYTASGPVGSTFSYSYAGRSANGITTSYSSASAPTAAGYYTVTATATGNYSGSNTADYFVAGPVAVSDAITKPAVNPSLVLTLASLLANDVRITPAGAVATDGLSITRVTNGLGNSAQIDDGDILFTPSGASPETFTYTLGYGIQTAIGTVTVTTESSAPTFAMQIAKVGTATYSAPNTTVTHDFIGVPGQTYSVEYSTDLTNWTFVEGNQSTGPTGSFSVTITKSGDVAADWNAHMFFRARLVR